MRWLGDEVFRGTRAVVSAAAERILEDEGGAVLRGTIDPAALFGWLSEELPRYELWSVAGSCASDEPRFAALSPYLTLTGEEPEGPLSAISALRALRRTLAAAGRRVLIVVERPEALDLGSATLLAAVCEEGGAQLLLLQRESEPLPTEFAKLLRENTLDLFIVGQLSTWGMVEALQLHLGGVVPFGTALRVHSWSGGVERWLWPAVDAARELGLLALREDGRVWAATGSPAAAPELLGMLADERALLSARAVVAYEALALGGARPASAIARRFGDAVLRELRLLESVGHGLEGCECVWLRAEVVRSGTAIGLAPARAERALVVAAALGADSGCWRHHTVARPVAGSRRFDEFASDLGAGVDLAHGARALVLGRWARAAERGEACRAQLTLADSTHAFSWMEPVARLMQRPFRCEEPGVVLAALDDGELRGFPELRQQVLMIGLTSNTPGVATRAITEAGPGARGRLLARIAQAITGSDLTGCFRAASDARHGEQLSAGVAALCGAVRLAGADTVALWRAAEELREAAPGVELPADVTGALDVLRLSERERELAGHARGERSAAEIAAALSLSQRTVEWHIGRILTRLGAASRAELRERYAALDPR